MNFDTKLLDPASKKVRCFDCFEKGVETTMWPGNLQRHYNRQHDGEQKRVATEEYVVQKKKQQEELRRKAEIEEMNKLREEELRAEELTKTLAIIKEAEEKLRLQRLEEEEQERKRQIEAAEEERKKLKAERELQEAKALEQAIAAESARSAKQVNAIEDDYSKKSKISAEYQWEKRVEVQGLQMETLDPVFQGTSCREASKENSNHMEVDNAHSSNLGLKNKLRIEEGAQSKRQKTDKAATELSIQYATKSDLDAWGSKILSEVKAAFHAHEVPKDSKTDSKNSAPSNQVDNETLVLIRNTYSMPDLLRYASDFKVEDKRLICKPCKSYHQGTSKTKFGSIKCDFTENDKFAKGSQPEEFVNLKTRIKEHLATAVHKKSKSVEEINKELDKEELNRNYTAGLNFARNAYKCIKLHDSYAQFESEMQIDAEKKVPLGELNHSASFAKEMTQYFYSTLRDQHKEILKQPLEGTQKPRPFSIVSDKATPNRATLHIIGMISQMDDKLQPVIMDIVEARDGSGVGLAKDLYMSMKNYFTDDEIRSRLVSTSWDGQYFHCNVHRELMTMLEIREEDQKFYAAQYDVAHLIELADKNARSKSESVKNTYDSIAKLNQKCGYGKNYMTLFDKHNAKNQEEDKTDRYKRLKPFSATRFATYTGEVIEAARSNYAGLYEILRESKDPLFDKLSNSGFVLRINGLRDVYETIGRTSREVQQPDVYSWHIDKTVENCSKNLDSMIKSFEEEEFQPTNINLKHYNRAVRELQDDGTFQAMPVKISKQPLKELRSSNPEHFEYSLEQKIRKVNKELRDHIEHFKTNFEDRYQKRKAEMCVIDKNCFSMDNILSRPTTCIPRDYKKCVDISQRTKLIDPSVSLAKMQEEYQTFAKVVHNKVANWKANYLDRPVNEQKIYDSLLNANADLKQCRNVAQLLAAATTRTHCEAVTEGMGSVVGRQLTERKGLTTDRLAMESYICFNGPFPGKEANPLLERSLDKKFGSRENWHFYRKTKRMDKLKDYEVSKVVDRATAKCGKIPFRPLNNKE